MEEASGVLYSSVELVTANGGRKESDKGVYGEGSIGDEGSGGAEVGKIVKG